MGSNNSKTSEEKEAHVKQLLKESFGETLQLWSDFNGEKKGPLIDLDEMKIYCSPSPREFQIYQILKIYTKNQDETPRILTHGSSYEDNSFITKKYKYKITRTNLPLVNKYGFDFIASLYIDGKTKPTRTYYLRLKRRNSIILPTHTPINYFDDELLLDYPSDPYNCSTLPPSGGVVEETDDENFPRYKTAVDISQLLTID